MLRNSLVAICGLALAASCGPPPAAGAPAAPPPSSTTPAATGGARPPGAQGDHVGVIIGTVVTEPYHAIKKGAVVYLEDGPKEPGVGMTATIDNHDMTFVPFITVITTGGTVTFGNTDPMTHNAFSPDGDGWDIGQIPVHGAVPKTFDKPSIYSVLCNLHKNMLAYLVVTPSSYFARTNPDGTYALSAPPGTYHVTAWSPRLKPVTKTVTVPSSEVTLNFELSR